MTNKTLNHLFLNSAFYLVQLILILTTTFSTFAQDKNDKSVPKLSGEWKFNKTSSDDVKTKLKDMMQPPGGMGGMSPDGPPPGMMGGGMPNRETMQAMREKMEKGLTAPEKIFISQSDTEITIINSGIDSDDEGSKRIYFIDGRKPEKGEISKAKFNKSQFIIETKRDKEPKIVETYELSKDSKQLIVIIKMETNFGNVIKLRRVYDAA